MTSAAVPRRVLWIPGWTCDARTMHPLVVAVDGGLDHGSVGWRDCLRDWRQKWGSENGPVLFLTQLRTTLSSCQLPPQHQNTFRRLMRPMPKG